MASWLEYHKDVLLYSHGHADLQNEARSVPAGAKEDNKPT